MKSSNKNNKCRRCKQVKTNTNVYECYECNISGCDKCIQPVCCDCSVRMCNIHKGDGTSLCACYGKCSNCRTDVNRGNNGWPCYECRKWYCDSCRNNCEYNKCSECNEYSESDECDND